MIGFAFFFFLRNCSLKLKHDFGSNCIFFFPKKFIYLKVRGTEERRGDPSIHWFTPRCSQRSGLYQAEPRACFRPLVWLAGTQTFGKSSAFTGPLAESWGGSGTPRQKPAPTRMLALQATAFPATPGHQPHHFILIYFM